MKCLAYFFAFLAAVAAYSATLRQENNSPFKADIREAAKPWSRLEFQNNPGDFQFAIVTDRTGGHRQGIFEGAVGKLNLLQPEFVMSVGDLIEGYTLDTLVINRQWEEFQGFIGKLQMPFFYVPGNHDYSNAVLAKKWTTLFGPSYYHFIYKNVLFLCLNSEMDLGDEDDFGEAQVEYVRKTLSNNPSVRWTLIFFHQPLWVESYNNASWKKMEDHLKDRPYTVFAGHFHQYTKYLRNNRQYYILATTGGGSGLRGPAFGEFDHVAWVTMKEEGPRVANLMLDGIWDDNIRDENTTRQVDRILRQNQLQFEPLFIRDDSPRETLLKARLKNDCDIPMRITGEFEKNSVILTRAAEIDREVAPNSVAALDIPVALIRPAGKMDFSPLIFKGKAHYRIGDREIKVDVVRRIGVPLMGGDDMMECEMMNLSGYEPFSLPDGQGLIQISPDKPAPSQGSAMALFEGKNGTYDITVVVAPENDGAPALELYVDSVKVMDKTYPAGKQFKNWHKDRVELRVEGIKIKKGAAIKLAGTSNDGACARVDKILFKRRKG